MDTKTFIIDGIKIEFNKSELYEINIIRELYKKTSFFIQSNFKNKFFELNAEFKENKKKVTDSYDYFDFYNNYTDKISELLLHSCKDIIYSVVNILKNIDENYILTEEGKESIYSDIEDGLSLNHPYFYYEEKQADFFELVIKYNNTLKTNLKEQLLFFHHLSLEIAISITITMLMELENFQQPNEFIEDDNEKAVLTFNTEEIFYYMIYNNTRKIRQNIEKIGINNINKERYLKSFQQSPFNLEAYFYIVENNGDKNYELQELYNFVLGDEVLEIYKSHLMLHEFLEKYSIKVLDNTADEEKANKINSFITDLGTRYGLKKDTNLNFKAKDMLKRIDKAKRTVNGIEYENVEEAEKNKKLLNTFYEKVNKSSLLKFQLTLDQLNANVYDENILKDELSQLNKELKVMKIEYKECKDKYNQKKIKSIIIILFILYIMIRILSIGIIGIVIDIVVGLAILGYYEELKDMKNKKNQYIEYEESYLMKKNK